MSVTDHSGTHWMTVFDEESKKLLGGVTADELENYRSEGSESKYEEAFQKANFTTYVMKCRVKAEQVNDEERIKVACVAAEPLDYVKECNDLIQAIETY